MDPDSGNRGPVAVDVALIILPEAGGHPDEGCADHQFAHLADHGIPLKISDGHVDSWRRGIEAPWRNWFDLHAGEQRARHLGAAGIVDDRAAIAGEAVLIPLEMLGID